MPLDLKRDKKSAILPAQKSVSISSYDVKSSKKSDPAASSSCVLYIL